jgi:hypothetical protein
MKKNFIYLVVGLCLFIIACGSPAPSSRHDDSKYNITCYSGGKEVYKVEDVREQTLFWHEENYSFNTSDGMEHWVPRASCYVEIHK